MFQILNYLTAEKKSWSSLSDEEKKNFNVFFMNRILSFDEDIVEIVNFMQKNSNIPVEQYYNFWLNNLPSKRLYLKYLKKNKSSENNDLLLSLANYLSISSREVREYIHMIDKKILHNILGNIGYDQKQIKKLLK